MTCFLAWLRALVRGGAAAGNREAAGQDEVWCYSGGRAGDPSATALTVRFLGRHRRRCCHVAGRRDLLPALGTGTLHQPGPHCSVAALLGVMLRVSRPSRG